MRKKITVLVIKKEVYPEKKEYPDQDHDLSQIVVRIQAKDPLQKVQGKKGKVQIMD